MHGARAEQPQKREGGILGPNRNDISIVQLSCPSSVRLVSHEREQLAGRAYLNIRLVPP